MGLALQRRVAIPEEKTFNFAPSCKKVHELVDCMPRLAGMEPVFEQLLVQQFLAETAPDSAKEPKMNEPHQADLRRLWPSIIHTIRYFDQDLALEQLAALCNLSIRHYQRLFKVRTGIGPAAFICHIRLVHACHQLAQDSKSITHIAYDSGFNDSNYFTRTFGRVIGVSPREYRKHHLAS